MTKQNKYLHTNDIGLPGQVGKIFIATHLPPHKELLYKKAREMTNHGVKYVWEKFGTLYARISEDTQTTIITKEEDVSDLMKKVSLY